MLLLIEIASLISKLKPENEANELVTCSSQYTNLIGYCTGCVLHSMHLAMTNVELSATTGWNLFRQPDNLSEIVVMEFYTYMSD